MTQRLPTTRHEDITWTSDDLSMDFACRIMGTTETKARLAGASHWACRAQGWWDANEREYHAACKSIAKILDRETIIGGAQ